MTKKSGIDLNAISLLSVARALSKRSSQGELKQAQIRRAISSAYYAVFHLLLRSASDTIVERSIRQSAFYSDFYRSIDHSQIKAVCNQVTQNGALWAQRFGRADVFDDLKRVAQGFLSLNAAREVADYSPTSHYAWEEAMNHVNSAQELVDLLTKLDPSERRNFLLACSLKEKKR